MSDFIGLNDTETKYFLLLVEIGKAGSSKLKQRLLNEATSLSEKVSVRISNSSQIDDKIKSIYYSTWICAAIRNLVATSGNHNVNNIAVRLGLPNKVVANVVEFLLENKLCAQDQKGIHYMSSKTHLDIDSPYINNHHRNWRQKGIEIMEDRNPSNLFFTSPMSLSEKTAKEIRKRLPHLIEEVMKKVEISPSEKVYCLNLDWFEF